MTRAEGTHLEDGGVVTLITKKSRGKSNILWTTKRLVVSGKRLKGKENLRMEGKRPQGGGKGGIGTCAWGMQMQTGGETCVYAKVERDGEAQEKRVEKLRGIGA